ncbi:hypothetical protein PNEG_02080 [Pneumocystis murina B123]|uniref:Deacetylase sirtuin-type domain-containing protein n=1 Tax=Pneumocystis murina (strain B123) TaxID=1069680 RepID=M7NQV3_PNEMU|nr:hypothetical protein PNEG_02080 [Pneumocystis murina B123]EMR09491.1 hypothetical protein PNEG_02080 [Pneumocystis murina B123]
MNHVFKYKEDGKKTVKISFEEPLMIDLFENKNNDLYIELVKHVMTKSKKVVVFVGAGISTGAGIPDFRSENGLFATLRSNFKLKTSGQDLFDISVYKNENDMKRFHKMISDLYRISASAKPTLFHEYLAALARSSQLIRLYTQNIDFLETRMPYLESQAPLPMLPPWPKTIQLHGGLQNMICSKCYWTGPYDPDIFKDDSLSVCHQCIEMENIRTIAGKRNIGVGKLRPRIVLYNEYNLDSEAIGKVTEYDLKEKPDALIVAGTSLKIAGARKIVREMIEAVKASHGVTIWINTSDFPKPKEFEKKFDIVIKGDCQKVADLVLLKNDIANIHSKEPSYVLDPSSIKQTFTDDLFIDQHTNTIYFSKRKRILKEQPEISKIFKSVKLTKGIKVSK